MVVNQSSYLFLRNNTYYFSRVSVWILEVSMVLDTKTTHLTLFEQAVIQT